jgi:hypothetical protein
MKSPAISEASMFFFEKKNQKTFMTLAQAVPSAGTQLNKVFLLLFLQKKKAFL